MGKDIYTHHDQRPDKFRAPTTEERMKDMWFAARQGAQKVEFTPKDPSITPGILIKEGHVEILGSDSADQADELLAGDSQFTLSDGHSTLAPEMQAWITFVQNTTAPAETCSSKKQKHTKGPGRYKKS